MKKGITILLILITVLLVGGSIYYFNFVKISDSEEKRLYDIYHHSIEMLYDNLELDNLEDSEFEIRITGEYSFNGSKLILFKIVNGKGILSAYNVQVYQEENSDGITYSNFKYDVLFKKEKELSAEETTTIKKYIENLKLEKKESFINDAGLDGWSVKIDYKKNDTYKYINRWSPKDQYRDIYRYFVNLAEEHLELPSLNDYREYLFENDYDNE